MIVKICDSCQKLLFDDGDCAWVAVREHGALLFKKWQSGMADKSTVSHFCSSGCTLKFCDQWLEGKLTEPVVEVRQGPQPWEPESPPAPPMRDPTPQEIAEQRGLLGELGIR